MCYRVCLIRGRYPVRDRGGIKSMLIAPGTSALIKEALAVPMIDANSRCCCCAVLHVALPFMPYQMISQAKCRLNDAQSYSDCLDRPTATFAAKRGTGLP